MAGSPKPPRRFPVGVATPLVLIAFLGLAYLGRAPFTALPVAVAGVVIATLCRGGRGPSMREASLVPLVAAAGFLAFEASFGPLPELLAGFAGVTLVLWATDDPARPVGGVHRGVLVWGLPAMGVAVAWTSTFVLPPSAAPLGVAGGLLAAALIAIAVLVRSPRLFDEDAAATL